MVKYLLKMKKYIYISLFTFTMAFTACSSLDESGVAESVPVDGQNIRLHATIKSGTRMEVPSDIKTDWENGDMIFMILDGGDGNKAIKATYDGSKWSFAEWYNKAGMPDFKSEGGSVTFAMSGENLNLSSDAPSNYAPSKTTARQLTNYTGAGKKVGDIMSTYSGTYTVSDKGIVDIYLNFERPMAKIHIKGVYASARQIRNHIEGKIPSGIDNAAGTNANYNKAVSMTLKEISRYMPASKEFRDVNMGNNLKGGFNNMVFETRKEDAQIIDAVYYGTMEPDENGDLTIVLCTSATTYTGIQANEELGSGGMKAYWRKFPGKSINPGDNIYIYGPMSEEEATLWHSQAITGEVEFNRTSLDWAENDKFELKAYYKWKTPAPSNRTLTYEVDNPNVITVSDDGKTLYTHNIGSSKVTATTVDGKSASMTVNVKNVADLVDETKSKWGTSLSTTYRIGWEFVNTTTVDLVVTRVAMMVGDEEVEHAEGLSVLARLSGGSAQGELQIKEANVPNLSTSKLRITYTYDGKEYFKDIPFTGPKN